MIRQIYIFFVWSLLFLPAAGCDSSQDTPTGQTTQLADPQASKIPDNTPVTGGTYTTGSIGEPSVLIPLLASDSASSEINSLLYVAPLKYDKDLRIVPWAARSFEVLNDGKLLKFRLRPGIRWTDGKELTAEDVEFTYQRMIDPTTPTAYAESFRLIKEFRRTGRYTFEVSYEKPYAKALGTWTSPAWPKHLLENVNLLETDFSRNPVGNGPYILKKWDPGSSLTLVPNPDYFEGRPWFDACIYRIIPDPGTMFLELKAGNLDIMNVTPPQYTYQVTGPFWEKNFTRYQYLSFGYTYMAYNLNRPLFQDVRIRRALAHAVDNQALVKGVLLGLGTPVTGPYRPNTLWYNQKIQPYSFSPDKANTLLAEAGWADTDGDGWLDKDGKPFAFTLITNQGNTERIKAGTIIQSYLKKIGIDVQIRPVEWAAFLREFVDKGNFDALILGWSSAVDPDQFNVWHSSRAVSGGLNFVGFRHQEVDELLETGRHLVDIQKRKAVYDRLQEILHEEQPYMFLYAPQALPVISSRIQNVSPAPAGITHNFEKWWIPENRQQQVLLP